MAEDLCACCDLPLYSCGRAIAEQKAADQRAQLQRALQEPGVVPAQHMIRSCPGCRSVVPVGHPIRKTPDGWVGVLCCNGTNE